MENLEDRIALAYERSLRTLSDDEVMDFHLRAGEAMSDVLKACCLRELQRRQLIN